MLTFILTNVVSSSSAVYEYLLAVVCGTCSVIQMKACPLKAALVTCISQSFDSLLFQPSKARKAKG